MYRKRWLRLVVFALLAISLCSVLSENASAESTVEVLSAPEVQPKNVFAHGDGSVTVASGVCGSESKENSLVTISSGGTVLSAVPQLEGEWKTNPCIDETVPGLDSTTYVVQVGQTPKSYGYPYRVIADRSGSRLWIASFIDPAGCSKRTAAVHSMAMGQDGNLYVLVYWSYKSAACPEKEAFSSIDPSTGAVRFTKILPNVEPINQSYNEVMPYENGVAVLDRNEVFYFTYEGEEESSRTFTTTSPATVPFETKIVPETGRVYWWSRVYNSKLGLYENTLYYHDLEGSTSEKVALFTAKLLLSIAITPFNGVVAEWKEGETKGFTYFNEAGSVVYEQVLTTESGATVEEAGLPYWLVVDDFGNVIVRRMIHQSSGDEDHNIVVDSFSPADVKTRLFNSASLGTEGVRDSFSSTSHLVEGMSQGHVYLMLCHVVSLLAEGCDSKKNPVVVSISDTTIGTYDYPHAAIFAEASEKLSYVALGDSYSSGEGVPSFIPPSDEDGCHRSYDAYPTYLVSHLAPSLRLEAFVACSGAKTDDVEEGMNGESAQINSLDLESDIVTITAGGDNIGFKEFAEECVVITCDSASPAYEYSMERIVSYLPEELEKFYTQIRSHAVNAEVYVIGYPQVAPEPGVSCTFLVDSEKEAAREVVAELDRVIEGAVKNAGEGFTYVDPNSNESPFVGHELCMEESYFNGAEYPVIYSFHPNKRGQQAYAELMYLAL